MSDTTGKERIKELTNRLESGIRGLYESKRYKQYLDVMSKFNNYSAGNIMLILEQNPEASLVATYQTWQREHERQVGKGEKAIYITPATNIRHMSLPEFPLLGGGVNRRLPTVNFGGNIRLEQRATTGRPYGILASMQIKKVNIWLG